MSLKTPAFWYRAQGSKASWKESALSPLSSVYTFCYNIHHRIKSAYKSDILVICIGNLVAGGTGKTPASIALLKSLKGHDIAQSPYFLIRGYGGAEVGPVLVDLDVHTSWDVGDEALLLAKYAPTIAGADRALSAQMAQELGADLLIMDDGLQNPGIHKDLQLVVVNGEMGFGNQKLIPAGPLRQSLDSGFAAADGFILIGDDVRNVAEILPKDRPLIQARLRTKDDFSIDPEVQYLAFAGLGYPKKFFNFLKSDLKAKIVGEIPFCDHYPYEDTDLQALHEKAQALNARLITTEKDFKRLPALNGIEVEIVPVALMWQNEDSLVSLLRSVTKQ